MSNPVSTGPNAFSPVTVPHAGVQARSFGKLVFLDTGVLGVVTHPKAGQEARECILWLKNLLAAGVRVCVPEICDYELRREYLRRNASNALRHLDQLNAAVTYVPINTATMKEAAKLWADARNKGHVTADPKELDGDVILVAQAQLEKRAAEDLIVATTNVGHLAMFVHADEWRNIAVF